MTCPFCNEPYGLDDVAQPPTCEHWILRKHFTDLWLIRGGHGSFTATDDLLPRIQRARELPDELVAAYQDGHGDVKLLCQSTIGTADRIIEHDDLGEIDDWFVENATPVAVEIQLRIRVAQQLSYEAWRHPTSLRFH